MLSSRWIYFWLDAGTILFPFLLSFDKKVHYYKRFKYLIPAIILPALPFVLWDSLFTEMGIWHFSDLYTVGAKLGPLPLEEWLFFVAVPFGCIFIYDCLNRYLPWWYAGRWVQYGTMFGVLGIAVLGLLYVDRMYTAITAAAFVLSWGLQVALHGWTFAGRIWRAWLVCQLPFFLVNGILTALPVVIYNDAENLGLRIYTVPAEDTFYGMTLFLLNITVYEYVQRRSGFSFAGSAREKVAA